MVNVLRSLSRSLPLASSAVSIAPTAQSTTNIAGET